MRIAIIDGIAAHYRLSLFQKLSSLTEHEYTVYASEKPLQGIKTIDPDLASLPISLGGLRWKFLSNLVLKGRIFWQKEVFSICSKGVFTVYIFIGEAHALSTWLGVFICKIRKKKVVFWGHGLYGNEKFLKKVIRNAFNKLPDAYLVYDKRAAELLIRKGFDPGEIFVLNNSLNYTVHQQIRNNLDAGEIQDLKRKLFPLSHDLNTLLYIGRLIPGKKIDQLIKSVEVLHKKGMRINLLIIGTGVDNIALKDQVHRLNLDDYVTFYGECYDEKKNGMMISLSDCCVSPGNVGLTSIHCMSFGTPVISHGDYFRQMPEISSIIEGVTGELFEKDDIDSLCRKIQLLIFERGKAHYTNHCLELIDKFYNPEYQKGVFNDMINHLFCKEVQI